VAQEIRVAPWVDYVRGALSKSYQIRLIDRDGECFPIKERSILRVAFGDFAGGASRLR
jgi:hypothetical protein